MNFSFANILKYTTGPRSITLLRWGGRLGLLCVILACLLISGIYAASFIVKPPELGESDNTSTVVLDRQGKLLRPFATKEGRWRLPVKLSDVDPHYIEMLIAYEDKRFYNHSGVDPLAMVRAFGQLVRHGRIISGGSTLTMQLARLAGPRENKSLSSKLKQIVHAIQIERALTKEDILRRYLTLAPFGGNIEGIRAASLAYFGKEPQRLSVHEIALLVSLPQSPETRRPDRFPIGAKKARDHVLERFQSAKLIGKAEVVYARQKPVPMSRKPFPMHAAHLTDRIVKQNQQRIHRLTIDRQVQIQLELLARSSATKLGNRISTAILAVDHKSGKIIAHIGSPGYLDRSRFGAIDMVEAVRSPGSALKPFIYGLAIDSGLAHPETLIEDRPARFGDYAPENFDHKFRGTVTIREALQLSLNVPAVKVLAAIGPARLSAWFRQTGLSVRIPRNLTVALGGSGLRLSDLAILYSALARGGQLKPLVYQPLNTEPADQAGHTTDNFRRILSPQAAWHIADILSGSPPPKNAKRGSIAYKTGTSYGHRDAWAVGFDGRYVIAVWAGRPDGTATPGLTGLTAAAPLLFDAFQRIGRGRTPLRPAPKGTLVATTSKLPKPLVNFREPYQNDFQVSSIRQPLSIAFPPNDAQLEIGKMASNEKMPILLKAEGGKLPLTWLADGAPIQSDPHRRSTFWSPRSRGFVKFSVIDAEGRVDRVSIRVR